MGDVACTTPIIDTVIFIDSGEVRKVYELNMTVKLPTGLREAELARPVIEVKDFITGELEYEIYTFGEQTVVVPIKGALISSIETKLRSIFSSLMPNAEVRIQGTQVHIVVPREDIRSLKRLKRKLRKIEQEYGVKINLRVV